MDYDIILQGEQQALLDVSRQENMATGKVEEMKEIAQQMRDNKNRQLGRVQMMHDIMNMPGEDEGATTEDEGVGEDEGATTPAEPASDVPVEEAPAEEARVERGPPRDTGDKSV